MVIRHALFYPDRHQGSWLKQFKQNIVYEGCHSDVLVCLSSPPPFELPVADFGKVAWGVRAVEPRCEFESGANYFAPRFPPRGRAYTEPRLFICLFVFAFADCHSIECICFSAAAMSQGLCWIHFPLVSEARAHTTTTSYTHPHIYCSVCQNDK